MTEQNCTWSQEMSTVLDATFKTHGVGGKQYKFYPLPIETAFKMRAFVAPLTKMLSTMFEDTSKDGTVVQRNVPGEGEEIIAEAVSETVARMRADRQTGAITGFVDQITSDDAKERLAEIIMASMRENFPATAKYPVQEFLNVTPLPIMGQLLYGVWLANKDVFGPLGKAVEAVSGMAKDRIKDRMGGPPSQIKLSGAPSSPDDE